MEYNGQVGYVFGDYLTTTAPQSQPAATTDVDSPVVAVVPAGTALHRVAYTADGWSIVLYNGETVYCATQYVTQ